jgi:hypothetical protein
VESGQGRPGNTLLTPGQTAKLVEGSIDWLIPTNNETHSLVPQAERLKSFDPESVAGARLVFRTRPFPRVTLERAARPLAELFARK